MKNDGFFRKTLNSISDNIAILDVEGNILFVNQSWIDFASSNEYKNQIDWEKVNYIETCKKSIALGDKVAKQALEGIEKVLNEEEVFFNFEYPCHGENEPRWFIMNVNLFLEEQEKYLVISHKNITQRILKEEKTKKLSMLDSLTSLPNRRTFNLFFEKEWYRNKREQTPLTLAILDIDDFKVLNDTFGHQIGDKVLQEVALMFNENIKRTSDLCARYGGEEFIIVFSNSDFLEIKHILENILKQIKKIKIEDNDFSHDRIISTTIGVSTIIPNDTNNQNELIKKADLALYHGKRHGKDQIVFFEDI